METTFFNVASLLFIVFGILQIILFFKIWGMTNNVNEIKEIMKLKLKKECRESSGDCSCDDIKIGDLVVELRGENQFKVIGIPQKGKYECRKAGIDAPAEVFDRNEIEIFDKYWEK